LSDTERTTRVTWQPVRGSAGGIGMSDVFAGTGSVNLHAGLGPCVVIHLDQMPHPTDAQPAHTSLFQHLKAKLVPPPYTRPPPWEEHVGVVDHPTATRVAAEHGVPLEVLKPS
jgi:hypothetical protein